MVINKKKRQHEDDEDNDNTSSEDDSNNNSRKKLKPLIKVSAITNENKNKKLTDMLSELGVFEKNKGQIHKYTAYRKAVLSIKSYPNEIKSGLEAQKLDGVGKKIAKKIDEILLTGSLKKLNTQNQDETLIAINQLSRVTGIGPSKAKSLVQEGITTIEALNKIKNTLTHHQQIGLKYFNDFEQRVPRSEIEIFEKLISDSLFNIDPSIISQVCGSYRRGLESSGDIDILISHPKFTLEMKDKKKTFSIIEKLVDLLKKKHILIDDLSLGPLKYMGVCRLPDNIKINNNSYINNKNNSSSSSSSSSSNKEDESDCDTTLNESNSNSSEEDFSTDSSATEPEDNSKVKKKVIKKVEKNPKTTTTIESKLSNSASSKTSKASESNKNNKPTNKTTTTTTTTSSSSASNETHTARRIDFKLIPYESYYFGLLHSTGSDEFNRQMRGIALKQGYTLSEYSINKMSHGVKSDKAILVDSEKEIFDIIQMEYYPPNQRNL